MVLVLGVAGAVVRVWQQRRVLHPCGRENALFGDISLVDGETRMHEHKHSNTDNYANCIRSHRSETALDQRI